MNPTQLYIDTERRILLAQHVSGKHYVSIYYADFNYSGFIAFLFNIVVLALIFMDVDIRNKGFRKYICVMVVRFSFPDFKTNFRYP